MSSSPRLGRFILKKIYNEELYTDISGDFEELFKVREEQYGRTKASVLYVRDAVLSVRNFDLKTKKKRKMTQLEMISSHFKMALRMIKKNPTTSAISILGFAMAIAFVTTTFLYADFMNNLDSIHTKRDRIYQLVTHTTEEGRTVLFGSSPMPLGPAIKESVAGVEAVTRIQHLDGNVTRGTQVFTERIAFVDPDFMNMFDFSLLEGQRNSLENKQSIMLSEDMVKKYFGQTDAIGKEVTVKWPTGKIVNYVVSAVLAKAPEKTSFKERIILPMESYFDIVDERTEWTSFNRATFVLLSGQKTAENIHPFLEDFISVQNQTNPDREVFKYELFPLDGLGNRYEEISDPYSAGNSKSGINGMLIVGILILVLSCLNYLNIAIASGARRLKEIGIRKVMGSVRQNLIYQFLTEHLVICGLSVIAGAFLCYFAMLPGFNLIAPVEVPFVFESMQTTVIFYLSIWVTVALLSGAYPAFYISKFNAITIFRGNQKFSKSRLSKVLLTIQLFIAFTTIVGSFIFWDNAVYVKSLGWGYEKENLLSVSISSQLEYDALKTAAESMEGSVGSVGTKGHVSLKDKLITFEFLEKNFKTLVYEVEPEYPSLIGLELKEGAFFNPSEVNNRVMVNDLFVEKMGWENAIGQRFTYLQKERIVKGVVNNARHNYSFKAKRPMLFMINSDESFDFLVVKYDEGVEQKLDEALEAAYHQVSPNDPYNRVFQSSIFDRFYTNVDANTKLMLIIGLVAILLSCLGLHGLISFSIHRRNKEFGIRIALGASSRKIAKIALKEYVWIMVITLIIGVPVGAYLIQSSLEKLFTVWKPFSMIPVLMAIFVMLSAFALTVSGKVRKATKINPVETLRD